MSVVAHDTRAARLRFEAMAHKARTHSLLRASDETDAQTGMLSRELESATCVQRFDDSLNSAIRITYRISLRSSSLWEPRYPLLRVVRV